MDYFQNRTMHDMAEASYQCLEILERYMGAIGYPTPDEITGAMEWLANTMFKLNEESLKLKTE